jgi:hypothetical protein
MPELKSDKRNTELFAASSSVTARRSGDFSAVQILGEERVKARFEKFLSL